MNERTNQRKKNEPAKERMQENAESNITISVILPVYNVEKWIGDCIESLKRQKLGGLEFIFVDDCSSDDSVKVIESWMAQDDRVRILKNEENMGSGPTRNRGIQVARGEYLSFVDPDDWVSDDFYQLLYNRAKNTGCHIVKGSRIRTDDPWFRGDGSETDFVSLLNKEIREKRVPLYCIFRYEHQTAIFKRDFFQNQEIRYGDSRVSQDTTFLLKVCFGTEDIITEDDAIYYYRQREGAATYDYSFSRSMGQLRSLEEKVEFFRAMDLYDSRSGYFGEGIKNYLTNYYYATESEVISKEDNLAYINKLKSILEDTEVAPALLHDIPELEILLDQGHVIPPGKRREDKTWEIPLKRWTEFFIEYSDTLKKEYYKGYAIAFLRCYFNGRKDFFREWNNRKDNRQISVGLFKKLSKKDRVKVLWHIPATGLKVVARVVTRDIKRD